MSHSPHGSRRLPPDIKPASFSLLFSTTTCQQLFGSLASLLCSSCILLKMDSIKQVIPSYKPPHSSFSQNSPTQDIQSPACEKVFGISELWLGIIDFVDIKDVFTLLQVCHLFNDRINNDEMLLKRLFLQPEDAVIDNSRHRKGSLDTDAYNLKLNPFLAQISISPFIDWLDFAKRTNNSDPRPRIPLMQAWDEENKHICIYPVREGGSESRWNEMFITQPPITAVSLAVPGATNLRDAGSGYPKDTTVCNPAGLKIGDIVREWRKLTNGHEYSAATPACIVIHAWASYERFYSAYWTVLRESNVVLRRSLGQLTRA